MLDTESPPSDDEEVGVGVALGSVVGVGVAVTPGGSVGTGVGLFVGAVVGVGVPVGHVPQS